MREAVAEALHTTCGKRAEVATADVHAVVRFLIRREPDALLLSRLRSRLQSAGGSSVLSVSSFADAIIDWEADATDVAVLNR